jgi:hypothetical protein
MSRIVEYIRHMQTANDPPESFLLRPRVPDCPCARRAYIQYA